MKAYWKKQGEQASRPLTKTDTGGTPVLLDPNHAHHAFTMIELLVAMAVFSLLIVLLMGMVDGAAKLWRESENRVDAYREARAALGSLARDLNNALPVNNTNYILLNSNAFGRLPAEAVKDTNSASALFFLSAQPASAQDSSANKSDVCEVGYFLAYDSTSLVPNGAKSLNLYRYFHSSDGTYSNLLNGPTALYQTGPVTGDRTDLMARNVKSFRVTPYHVDTNGNCMPYNAALYGAPPDLVEISVTTLNQDTARKLTSQEDWTNSGGPITRVIKQVEQTFTTRVRVANKL